MSGAILLAWNLTALTVLCARVATALPPSWSTTLRATAGLTLAGVVPPMLLWIVHLAGALNAVTTGVVLSGLAAASWALPRPTRTAIPAPRTSGWWVALGWLGGGLGLWAVSTLAYPPRFSWDDLTYHLTSPAWWVSTGQLGVAPYTYQVTYPMHAELWAAWVMLPLHGDAYVRLPVLLWVTLAAVAMVALSRCLHQPSGAGMAAAGTFLLSWGLVDSLRTAVPVDIVGAAFLLAALALSLAPTDTRREAAAAAVLTGLALGGALGSRVTSAVPAALILVWWAIREGRAGRLHLLAGVVLPLLALTGPWYLRNWWLSGNPLFPAEVGPFDGPFDRAAQRQTSLWPFLVEGATRPRFWWDLLLLRWDWPLPVGLVAVLGWGAGLVRGLRTRRWALLLVTTVALAALFLFPFTPFSGTSNRPGQGLHDFIRYLSLSFALGLVLVGSLVRDRRLPLALTAVGLLTLWGLDAEQLLWVALGTTVCLGTGVVLHRAPRPPGVPHLALLGTCLLLPMVLGTGMKQYLTDKALFLWRGEDKNRKPGEPWRVLEEIEDGARIATFSSLPFENTFVYPYFGRHLQHLPVATRTDGTPMPPLYTRWRSEPDDWWWHFERHEEVDPETFVLNLLDQQIDILFIHKCQTGQRDWPPQHVWMETIQTIRPLFRNGCSRIYDLRDQEFILRRLRNWRQMHPTRPR